MPIVQPEPVTKKEKPFSKTPIPGTDWLRVKTTAGNIFYTHKVKKESIWTVPEEIKDAVQKLEEQERHGKPWVDEAERERAMEVERIKGEVQAMVKRKAEETPSVDEVVLSKKAKVEEADEEDDGEESDESEEEEWQREAAAQLAVEAEIERKRLEEVERARIEAEEEAKKAQLNMPDRGDLSIEEGKALFKVSFTLSLCLPDSR